MLQVIKYALTLIGKRFSSKSVRKLIAIVNYLEVGRWVREGGYDVTHRFESREELFDLVATKIAHCEVLYLEFGCLQETPRGTGLSSYKIPEVNYTALTASRAYRRTGCLTARADISPYTARFLRSTMVASKSSEVGSSKPYLTISHHLMKSW